jgi:phage tail tube protein FII
MWEVGGAPGMITDVSETLGLDKVESEVVLGACGAASRGGVRKNGSNE